MKKLFLSLVFVAVGCLIGHADSYYKKTIDSAGVSSHFSNTIDLNDGNITRVSAQVVYSTNNAAAVTFTDGAPSTATITVSSNTALLAAFATDSILIASNTALSGALASNTISIASNSWLLTTTTPTYISINGSTLTLGTDWLANSFSTVTATNLKNAINSASLFSLSASTTGTGSTVTLNSTIYGTAYNSLTLVTSTNGALPVGGATFSGGLDPAVLNFNGMKFVANRNFSVDQNFSTKTALNIANVLNFSSYSITATTSTIGVSTGVTLTALSSGTAANSFYLTSTTAAFTIASSSFTGGRDVAYLKINGVQFTAGKDFTPTAFSSWTAQALSDAISTRSALSGIVVSSWSSNVVYATTSLSNVFYPVYTSTFSALRISTAAGALFSSGEATGTFRGGSATSISTTTNFISATNSFTPALPVSYSRNSGSNPPGLVPAATYYVFDNDATKFRLSRTSTGAIAGIPLAISSQTAQGGGSFTLTPLPMTGTGTLRWQVSNDSVNWVTTNFSVSITSNALQNTTTSWAFGNVDYRWLRLDIDSTTAGAFSLKTYVNGK